eukprot:4228308-Lingulodinium_polyedra.AAC.1
MVFRRALESLVRHWKQAGTGFSPPGAPFVVSHAIWVDNIWLFHSDLEKLKEMIVQTTGALRAHGFDWKQSSLELLPNANVDPPESWELPGPAGFTVCTVDSMKVLGTLLDRGGSTAASVEHRLALAAKAFYSGRMALCDRRASAEQRIRGFMAGVGGCVLFSSE